MRKISMTKAELVRHFWSVANAFEKSKGLGRIQLALTLNELHKKKIV